MHMKNILLSADGEISVYSVPDEIADNLRKHCMEFCDKWLCESPDAARYYMRDPEGEMCLCYDESDFIDYLNNFVCDTPSVLVEKLTGVYEFRKVPKKYSDLPWFNF